MKEQATKAAGPKAHSAAHGRVITFTLRPRSTAGQSEDLSGPDKLLQYVPWFLARLCTKMLMSMSRKSRLWRFLPELAQEVK